jgi:hypothetical protein
VVTSSQPQVALGLREHRGGHGRAGPLRQLPGPRDLREGRLVVADGGLGHRDHAAQLGLELDGVVLLAGPDRPLRDRADAVRVPAQLGEVHRDVPDQHAAAEPSLAQQPLGPLDGGLGRVEPPEHREQLALEQPPHPLEPAADAGFALDRGEDLVDVAPRTW